MKKVTTTIFLALIIFSTSAQTSFLLLRKDTMVLKSSECNWLFSSHPNQTVGSSILKAIEAGKLIAIDPNTGKIIPATKISTWMMPTDTAAVFDNKTDKTGYQMVQSRINPARISEIRMQQDWYLDGTSGKIFSKIKWIEPRIEIYNGSETFIGYRTFCHIDYP